MVTSTTNALMGGKVVMLEHFIWFFFFVLADLHPPLGTAPFGGTFLGVDSHDILTGQSHMRWFI